MALDVGDARIGVAFSDPTLLLATPSEIVERKAGGAIEKIAALVAAEFVDVVVAGLPMNMDGSLGKQAGRTQVHCRGPCDSVEFGGGPSKATRACGFSFSGYHFAGLVGCTAQSLKLYISVEHFSESQDQIGEIRVSRG
jgi:hypothetical protein